MNWEKKAFSDGVLEIDATSWRGFVEYAQGDLSNYRDYIYRGQREPDWKLIPSLSRVPSNGLLTFKYSVNALDAFKQASRGRRGPSPPHLDDNEWWALGQHHGLRTPLLDWTKSPFVAAFFAFATARAKDILPKPRMVYGLAKQLIQKRSEEISRRKPGTILTPPDVIDIISPLVDDNSRLVSQQGMLTKARNLDREIEMWVRRNFSGVRKAVLIKISIIEEAGGREEFLRLLNRMNINYLSLFPDLGGAAKHCNMDLEIAEY